LPRCLTAGYPAPADRAPGAAASGVRGRLIRGFGATALGPVVAGLVQVVTVPILLRAWGAALYGTWLVLSAIPGYLALSDVGFGTVAANEMTIRVAAGDRRGALAVFQSTWVLVTLLTVVIGLAVAAAAALLPVSPLMTGPAATASQVRATFVLLSISALIAIQNTLILAGFRCNGRFASGGLILASARLTDALILAGVAGAGGSLVMAAATGLAARVATTLMFAFLMLRATPWLAFDVRYASAGSVRALLRPAAAFMAFPAADAISLQGMILVVGAVLGPVSAAGFSTMRTLTRFALQCVEAVKKSFWPEMSMAYGAGNGKLARTLHRYACQYALLLSLAAIAVLSTTGHGIYTMWTHGRLAFQPSTFYLLLALVACNSLWSASSIATMAANRHVRCGAVFLGTAILSVALALPAVRRLGTAGAAAALLVADLSMGWYVIYLSLATLGERPADFARGLFSGRALLSITGRWRHADAHR